MKCKYCEKQASHQDPVDAANDHEGQANYMLVCDGCLRDPEKWIPGTWERVVDSVGNVWWSSEKKAAETT